MPEVIVFQAQRNDGQSKMKHQVHTTTAVTETNPNGERVLPRAWRSLFSSAIHILLHTMYL